MATAALQGALLVPLVIEKMLKGYQQEGAKAPTAGSDRGESAIGQNVSEEFLGEVLRFMDRVAASARESVQWEPIIAAQFQQRFLRALAGF